MSGLSDFFFGTPGQFKSQQTATPDVMNLVQQLLGGGQQSLQSGYQNLQGILSGSPQSMEAFQKPEMTRFSQQTVPGIAERFSGLGAGSQGSSAFGQQMGAAGANLSENLSAQRAGLQSGAMDQLTKLLGLGTGTQTHQTTFQEPQPGAIKDLLTILGQLLSFKLGG